MEKTYIIAKHKLLQPKRISLLFIVILISYPLKLFPGYSLKLTILRL